MSDDHNDYTPEEMAEICDLSLESIIEGMLIWTDMGEALVEDMKHADDCDGDCSSRQTEEMFQINKRHIDRVIESFRTSLLEVQRVKESVTSDASEVDHD